MGIRKKTPSAAKPRSRVRGALKRSTNKNRRPKPSFIEIKLGYALRKKGIPVVGQFKVARKRLKGRNFYLDFALPKDMIAIECDGQAFHSTPAQIRYDRSRQRELEEITAQSE